jgi:hypothetical protein
MNTTLEFQATNNNEVALDEALLRELANIEVVLIGGGDVGFTGA